jgi:hypothetical protein
MFALLLILSVAAGAVQGEPSFQYDVMRTKSLQKDEPGQVRIDASGIQYRSANGKTSITVPFIDVHEMNVSDPATIKIETYEMLKRKLSGRRSYVFRLRYTRSLEENDRLTQFLSERIRRPVLNSQSVSAIPEFEIPAYHRHALNGCSGTLQITPEGIRFLSSKEDHSRTWKYSEIQTFGGSDPFSFRVTTLAETFIFDLKERLPKEAYELVWQRVYDLPPRYSTANPGGTDRKGDRVQGQDARRNRDGAQHEEVTDEYGFTDVDGRRIPAFRMPD